MDQTATLVKIESFFKQNINQLVSFLADHFSCSKTLAQSKLLDTIVFPSAIFTSQMILQWHKSMEPFYDDVEGSRLDAMIASKSVWFLERIDFSSKWAALASDDRQSMIAYFKGLNKLARNYALLKSADLAAFVAAQASAPTVALPEMPADSKEQAEWAVRVTQDVVGSMTPAQVQSIVAKLPTIVAAMGGPDKVIEQARTLQLGGASESKTDDNPLGAFAGFLNPDTIRALVGGLTDQVRDVSVPAKSGETVALSDLVGDTTKVLTDLVEGKANTDQIAGLGQRLTDTVDWESIMTMMPPEMATMGRQLIGQLSAQTSAVASGEGAAEPVDMSNVMGTVSSLASSLMTPDSPFADLLAGLMQSAGSGNGESPLAGLLSPKK